MASANWELDMANAKCRGLEIEVAELRSLITNMYRRKEENIKEIEVQTEESDAVLALMRDNNELCKELQTLSKKNEELKFELSKALLREELRAVKEELKSELSKAQLRELVTLNEKLRSDPSKMELPAQMQSLNEELRPDFSEVAEMAQKLSAKMEKIGSEECLSEEESGEILYIRGAGSGSDCEGSAASSTSKSVSETSKIPRSKPVPVPRALCSPDRDLDGWKVLHCEAARGDVEMAENLLAKGFDARIPDQGVIMPLEVALRWKEEDAAEANCKIDILAKDGSSPLHCAAQLGYTKIVEKLLASGACTRVVNRRGRTPLHVALSSGEEAAARILVDADPYVDVQDELGQTPLHLATKCGFVDIARKLLISEVRPHVRDNEGWYPLDYALRPVQLQILKMIIAMCAWSKTTIDWKEMQLIPLEEMRLCYRLLIACHFEIRRLKETPIDDSWVCYYEVLNGSAKDIELYLEDTGFPWSCNALNRNIVFWDFPYYADFITFKVRGVLVNRCVGCFSILSQTLPLLPRMGMDAILNNLTMLEMRNFIVATEFVP